MTTYTKRSSDIFREALIDAKMVRELAVTQAKDALTEAMRPEMTKLQKNIKEQFESIENKRATKMIQQEALTDTIFKRVIREISTKDDTETLYDDDTIEIVDDEDIQDDEDAAMTTKKLYDILEDYADDLDDADIDEIISRSEADLEVDETDDDEDDEDDRLGELELDGYTNPDDSDDDSDDDDDDVAEETYNLEEIQDDKIKAAMELGEVWRKYNSRKTFADMNNVWSGGVGSSISDEDRTALQKASGLLREVISGKRDWNKIDRKYQEIIVERFGDTPMSRTGEDNKVAARMRKIANIKTMENVSGKSALERVLSDINNPISGTALNHKSTASLLTETGSPLSVKESAERLLKG